MSERTPEEVRESFQSLPEGWWTDSRIAKMLIGQFQRHLVALGVLARIGGRERYFLFTGFIIERGGFLHWITAGHCIETLQQLRDDPNISVLSARWHDNHPDRAGEAIPTALERLVWKHGSGAADFGVVWIPSHDQDLMRANPNLAPLTEEAWAYYEHATPEGLFLVGYPNEWRDEFLRDEGSGKRSLSIEAALVGIPVRETLDPAEQGAAEFWSHPHSVYGRISMEPTERELESIVGTSGGPLISVERRSDGRIVYRLIGVQSGWLSDRKIIRAIPIELVVTYLDRVMDDLRDLREAREQPESE